MQRRPPFRILCYTTAPRRVTHIYVHIIHMYVYIICIHVYIYIFLSPRRRAARIIPRWPNWNLSLPCDKKGAANFALANPSTRELYRKIVAESQLLPTRKYGVGTTRRNPAERISGCPQDGPAPLCAPENFSYKYKRAATPTDAVRGTSDCDLKGI